MLIPFLFPVLYMIAGITDIVRIRRGKSRIIKPLLMPLLILFYLSVCMTNGFAVQRLPVLALLASFAGDVLLIFTDRHPLFLIAGGVFFGLAHVFYTLMFLGEFTVLRPFHPVLAPAAPCAAAAAGGYLLYTVCRRFQGRERVYGFCYALVIICMCFSSSLCLFTYGTLRALAAFAGTLCFMVSDTLLVKNVSETLYGTGPETRRPVMQTYLMAQFLIVVSRLFTA